MKGECRILDTHLFNKTVILHQGGIHMTTYNAVKKLSDEQVKTAYAELKNGLPKGIASIVRSLQSELCHENSKTVPLRSVMYQVAMEVIERFATV